MEDTVSKDERNAKSTCSLSCLKRYSLQVTKASYTKYTKVSFNLIYISIIDCFQNDYYTDPVVMVEKTYWF